MKTQLEWIYFFPSLTRRKQCQRISIRPEHSGGGDSARDPECPVQGETNAGGMIFMTNWVILILIQDS